MPRVPSLDSFQVAPAGGGAPAFQLPSGGPASIAGRQAEELGQGLQRAGAGLTGIALDMAEGANRVREADAMNRFIAKRTDAYVKALQLRGRAALERPDGKALPDEVDEQLEAEARSISEGLGNDTQRQRFAIQAAQARQDLRLSLGKHMVQQQQVFKGETRAAQIKEAQNQGVLVWGDEKMRAQSAGAIAAAIDEQAADEGWDDTIKQERLRDALSPLHAGVLKGMLDASKPEMARTYYDANSASMTIQARAAAHDALEKGGRLVKAQRAADDIMGRGLPLDEAMKLIERDHEGEDERALKAEVQSRYSYQHAARQEAQLQAYGAAQLEVEQFGRVKPSTWANLTDAHRAAILNRQQAEARQRRAEAEGRPVKTDWSLYLELREQATAEPEKFARLDLKQYVDRIGGAQLEQLADLRGKLAAPKAAGGKEAITLTQQMNATWATLGLKGAAAKGAFISYVQQELDDEMQAKGKDGKPARLSFDERQKIIDRAVLQGPDPDAWDVLNLRPAATIGTKRMFELSPEQRARFKPNAPAATPPVKVNNEDEYRALPPGTRFITPDGKTGTKS